MLPVAHNFHVASFGEHAAEVGREVLEQLAIGSHQHVTVAEAIGLGLLVELHVNVAHGDIGVAPIEQNHGIDEQRQKEVHQHAANHDEQALPSRFGTELPRLFGLLHLFGVKALINHSRNLTIAAKR